MTNYQIITAYSIASLEAAVIAALGSVPAWNLIGGVCVYEEYPGQLVYAQAMAQ